MLFFNFSRKGHHIFVTAHIEIGRDRVIIDLAAGWFLLREPVLFIEYSKFFSISIKKCEVMVICKPACAYSFDRAVIIGGGGTIGNLYVAEPCVVTTVTVLSLLVSSEAKGMSDGIFTAIVVSENRAALNEAA